MSLIVTRPVPEQLASHLAGQGLSPLMARLYASRGVDDAIQLDYTLTRLLPFRQLKNATRMAARLGRLPQGLPPQDVSSRLAQATSGMDFAMAPLTYTPDGKAHVDYAFHLIVSDPTPQVLTEELPALIRAGYTSFKIYMTYDDLKLDDGQILATGSPAELRQNTGTSSLEQAFILLGAVFFALTLTSISLFLNTLPRDGQS